MSLHADGVEANHAFRSGNCTRLIATEIVLSTSPPITDSSYILDNACGPAIVTEQIKVQNPNVRIMASDLSPAMIEEVTQRIKVEGWNNMETATLDVRSLSSLKDDTFTQYVLRKPIFLHFSVLLSLEISVKCS